MAEIPNREEPSRGRPRRWASDPEKHRQYRAGQRERRVLLDELLHAVRNAHWEEPEVQQAIHHGDDAEVLRTLIAYYRQRYWLRRERR